MNGILDCVSSLWVLRTMKGRGLDLSGFKDEAEAIEQLIRDATATLDGPEKEAKRAEIRGAVERGMKHGDENSDDGQDVDDE